jgi:hypothetical protein
MSSPLPVRRGKSAGVVVGARSAMVLTFVLLMSCGGGGGGGGGGGDTGFSVTLNQSALTYTYYVGDSPTAQTVTGTIHGTYNGTVYVGAVVENSGATNAIDPNILLSVDSTQASAGIAPAASLPAGTYTGTVEFLACSDAACSNRIGGTPLPVAFTVNVLAAVAATPGSLTTTVTSGTPVVQDITVTPGANETGFTLGQPTAAFVQVSNVTNTGFRITLPSLPQGTYTASILLTGSKNSQSTFPITYTVTAPPGGENGLVIGAPGSLTFVTTEGTMSIPQVLTVTQPTWLPGLATPVVQYSQGQDWLQATATPAGYSVTADASHLSAGTYSANLVVQANPLPIQTGYSQLQVVPVSLTVGPGLVLPANVIKVVNAETTVADLAGTVAINVAGGPAATWNASSDSPWLTVSPSGQTGSSLTYTISESYLASATNYVDSTATVTVTAPGTSLTPMSFSVTASLQLPDASGVGAHVQAAGQATTLVVKGRGFNAIASPANRITVAGQTPTSVQRTSDHKMLLTFSGLSAGSHTVSVSNALGVTTATSDVLVVTPTAHAYSTVATGQTIQALIIDHQREILYAVHQNSVDNGSNASLTDGRVLRIRSGAGDTWSVDTPSIVGVDNVGVQHDGDLVVKTSPGTLQVLDGDDLTQKFSVDLGCTALDYLSFGGIPVTLDGQAWIATATINPGCAGSPRWGTPGLFDPSSQTFNATAFQNDPILGGRWENGPDFLMARNGERLVLNPHQSSESLSYFDVSDSASTQTNTQFVWNVQASSSDDGQRMVLDFDRVLDGQFKVVGRITIPDYSAPVDSATLLSAVVSPDGTRAYVLTARTTELSHPPTANRPRVFVLDISTDVGDNPVPVLGYFELPDYPSCIDDLQTCGLYVQSAISIDGATLYFAGHDLLVITPASQSLQQIAGTPSRATATGVIRTKPWVVSKAAR